MRERRCPYSYEVEELQETAWKLSRHIIKMTTETGSGNPSRALSAIDVLVALYFSGVMCYRPEQPDWPERDRFILSKGRAAPALYAVQAEAGYFESNRLMTRHGIESASEEHPNMRGPSGGAASPDSLGQGFSIGLDHARAARIAGETFRVYVMIGDGESNESQLLEAAKSAGQEHLDNLTVILDYTKHQQIEPDNKEEAARDPIGDKWANLGWDVTEINGHHYGQILEALYAVQRVTDKPQIIIAHTRKGRGLSPFQKHDVNRKHGVPLTEEEAEVALAELDEMKYTMAFASEAFTPELTREDVQGEI